MSYATLVIAMWAWNGLFSGFGYETAFPVSSEADPGLKSFLYGDAQRRFTSFFYHLAFVTAKLAGYDGSFVSYQLIYAALWLARGFLIYLIVCMLAEGMQVTAFLAGAFTIVHAADATLNWVGQLNQFGFIFWMLLGFYLVLRSFDASRSIQSAIAFSIASTFAAGLCIYSYESPLFLLAAFPILAISLFDSWSRRRILLVCVYYIFPAYYCISALYALLRGSRAGSYQFSVLRTDWGAWTILKDWLIDMRHAYAFWRWPGIWDSNPDAAVSSNVVFAFCLVGIVGLALGFFSVRMANPQLLGAAPQPRTLFKLFFLGVIMTALSFPAYLLLNDATSTWRTHLLSGPGVGVTFASLVVIAARSPWKSQRLGTVLVIVLSTMLVVQGVRTGQRLSAWHRTLWERHRTVIYEVLQIVPRVKPGTVIALVNHRSQPLPFDHNMWWDLAARLAYPKQAVVGIYYDKPGEPAPGVRVRLIQTKMEIASEFPTLFKEADLADFVVVDVWASGRLSIAEKLPDWFPASTEIERASYRPENRILSGPPDARAVRRYAPGPWTSSAKRD